MSSVMKYKDYIGSVEFSEEDQLFYGKSSAFIPSFLRR